MNAPLTLPLLIWNLRKDCFSSTSLSETATRSIYIQVVLNGSKVSLYSQIWLILVILSGDSYVWGFSKYLITNIKVYYYILEYMKEISLKLDIPSLTRSFARVSSDGRSGLYYKCKRIKVESDDFSNSHLLATACTEECIVGYNIEYDFIVCYFFTVPLYTLHLNSV